MTGPVDHFFLCQISIPRSDMDYGTIFEEQRTTVKMQINGKIK